MEEWLLKKDFAVIGLGTFGGSICKELSKMGMEVLAIDKDEHIVADYSRIATQAVVADAKEEQVLRELGIWNFDHVIVAIGNDIQSSILITIMLKELGVKKVTAKALNDIHEKVLRKVGADHVVHPERDMGRRLAHNLISSNVLEYLALSDKYSIVELQVNGPIVGRSLIDLNVRARYGINVVAIKRNEDLIVSNVAEEMLRENDILIAIGSDEDIARFEKKFFWQR